MSDHFPNSLPLTYADKRALVAKHREFRRTMRAAYGRATGTPTPCHSILALLLAPVFQAMREQRLQACGSPDA